MGEIGKMEKNSTDCERKQIVKKYRDRGKNGDSEKIQRKRKILEKKKWKKSVWKKLRIIGKQYRGSGKKNSGKKQWKKIL